MDVCDVAVCQNLLVEEAAVAGFWQRLEVEV